MIIQQQILPQIQNKHEQFLHCGLSKNMDWQLMTDQQLQQYQNQLLSLYQGLDPQQQISQQGFNLTKIQDKKPIQSLRFKELFFDSLEGNSHQILSLGFVQNQLQYKKLENQILKQTVSILFQISQKEKTFYPHLFTHIKQQFYKPNILTDLSQSDKQQSKYFQLINDFFNQSWQAPKYEQFIINNPQFQQICIFIFGKIAREDKRLLQINDCYHQSANSETKVFNLIEKICKKFLIETSYFGYQTPSIEMIAIGNEERFIFINDSNHLFVIKLQKLQLLNVRRKSSHNISVTNNEQTSNQSKNQKDKKKIKAKESYRIAYFGGQKTPENFQIQKSCFNMADEDDTSNFDSSFMKSQSKANQLSDQSTPKFKNSSISHARKKSHKDSFGGVDFDNLVYKDLSNPKRHILQKTRLKDLQINISHQKNNKKVLSQRFETNQIGSLTCGQDEDSQIEFLPHFQMQGTIQDQNSLSLFGNTPNSPAYSYQNHHINFSSFHLDAEFENPKNILTKKMKTSNIETSSKFFNYEDQYNFEQPNFLQQTNYNKQKFVPNRQNFNGNRVLATSQIIQFSGTQQNNHFQKKFDQMQETEDFLIIPSMSSKKESANQGFQGKSLTSVPHKEVFMSFSKNDKQKFLIPDIFVSDFQRPVNQQDKIRLTQKRFEKKDRSKNFQHDAYEITESQTNKSQSRNYVFWTEKQEREKYRSKLRLQNQSSLSHKSFKNLIAKDQSLIKLNKCHSAYQKYQNDSKKNIQVHYENTQEIENKQSKSHIFNSNLSQNLKLQRKHSSNIPVYQAVESPQQGQVRKSPELNFVNTRQQVSKRFQQNSVRFSQIIENQDDQIFYVKTKEDRKQGFGNKKQRKVTDIYEGPLVNVKKNGNKTSQVIQNSRDRQLKEQSNNFQSHLSINQDKLNVLINSGGGKNYSVLSNVSYDEQKRLQDLLEMESHLNNKNNQILASKVNNNNSNQYPTSNYFESELDFGNFQTVEKLIFRKKQQKNKLQTDLISISITNQSSKKIQQEPLNWYKKEVFYFFQPATAGVVLPPVKRVILNSNQQKQKQHLFSTNKNNNNKPFNFKNSNSNRAFINNNNNNSNKKDSMNSSTSLYNFSLVKNQQQTKQSQQRQGFVENSKGLFERKYSTQQIRPAVMEFRNQQMIGNSQRYCNQKYESCSNFGESSKSNSFVIQRNYSPTPIYMRQNNQNQNQHYYDGMNRNGDKLSVNTLEPSISSQRNSQFGQFTTKQGVINDSNKQQQIRTNQVTRQYNKQQQQPRIKFIWHNNQPSYHQCNNQPSYHQYNHQPVYSSLSQLIPSMTSMSGSIGKN